MTSISIPNSVTSIGSSAFFNSGLTSITLPNSLTTISWQTFADCTSLSSVTIPNSVRSINGSAFEGCGALNIIYCYAEQTPGVNSNVFNGVNVGNVMLVVPENSYEAYKAHEVWGLFMIETPTGIKSFDPALSKSEGEWYDISGRRINSFPSGRSVGGRINIVRMSDGTSKKVLVK